MGSGKNTNLERNLGCTKKGLKLNIWGLRSTDKEADQLLSNQIDLSIHEVLTTMEGEIKRWKPRTISRIQSIQSESLGLWLSNFSTHVN